jgi:serine/threonine protein kinase
LSTLQIVFSFVFLIIVISLIIIYRRRKRTIYLVPDEYTLLMGKKFDRYELKSFLVRGDFNTTYEAIDIDRNKAVAVRILDQRYIYNKTIVDQFSLKGELLKYLSERYPGNHFIKNIRFGAANYNEEIRPFIVTDYIHGASLGEVLRIHNRLSPRDAFKIINQIAETVALSHADVIWIRELAPTNILLSLNDSGELIAILANMGTSYSNLPTESDDIAIRKLAYYSPEDRANGVVDERSDIYALAALLYRMLEGKEYVEGEDSNSISSYGLTLLPALSEDKIKRPVSVEAFMKSIDRLRLAGSTVKDLSWTTVLSRILEKRQNLIPEIGDRKIFPDPFWLIWGLRIREFAQKWRRESILALKVSISLWLYEKIWNGWRKYFTIGGTIIAAAAIWLYLAGEFSGTINVRIRENSGAYPRPAIANALVTIEARDKKNNNIVAQDVHFELGYLDSAGRTTFKSRSNGKGTLRIHGHFKPEDIDLAITVQGNANYAGLSMTKDVAEHVDAKFFLRPQRTGTISLHFSAPQGLIRPGTAPPHTYTIEISAYDARGTPEKQAKYWIEGSQLLSIAGKAQSQDQQFSLVATNMLKYSVEDSSTIKLKIIPGNAASRFEFAMTPAKLIVLSQDSSVVMNAQLKRASGQPGTLVFTIMSEEGKPWEATPIEVFLNEFSIGSTGEGGKVEHQVDDIDDLWSQAPYVTLDLHTYKAAWGRSRKFILNRSNGTQFIIPIADIKPTN